MNYYYRDRHGSSYTPYPPSFAPPDNSIPSTQFYPSASHKLFYRHPTSSVRLNLLATPRTYPQASRSSPSPPPKSFLNLRSNYYTTPAPMPDTNPPHLHRHLLLPPLPHQSLLPSPLGSATNKMPPLSPFRHDICVYLPSYCMPYPPALPPA